MCPCDQKQTEGTTVQEVRIAAGSQMHGDFNVENKCHLQKLHLNSDPVAYEYIHKADAGHF